MHILMHFLIPFITAKLCYKSQWLKSYLIMIATMIVDLDHIFADPIYDPNRCSIGFHPLHLQPAIAMYVMMLTWQRTRLIGLGLVIHMALDSIDCQMTNGIWTM